METDQHAAEDKQVDQDEKDLGWSRKIANSVIEELVRGKVLREADWKRAEAIAAQQIHIHLISGDRPEGISRPSLQDRDGAD